MRWRTLQGWKEEELWRGTVFRVLKGVFPHEKIVDLMLIESDSSPSGFAICVVSGYKAGALPWRLPKSARAQGKISAISLSWLQTHWSQFVYDCDVKHVRLIAGFPAGMSIA